MAVVSIIAEEEDDSNGRPATSHQTTATIPLVVACEARGTATTREPQKKWRSKRSDSQTVLAASKQAFEHKKK